MRNPDFVCDIYPTGSIPRQADLNPWEELRGIVTSYEWDDIRKKMVARAIIAPIIDHSKIVELYNDERMSFDLPSSGMPAITTCIVEEDHRTMIFFGTAEASDETSDNISETDEELLAKLALHLAAICIKYYKFCMDETKTTPLLGITPEDLLALPPTIESHCLSDML